MTESVSLIVDGLAIRTKIGKAGVEKIFESMASAKSEWIALPDGDGEIRVRLERISAIQIKPEPQVLETLQGVSVREICDAAPDVWKYPTLVRKVNKPDGLELEMASPRRVILSEKNIDILGLSPRHVSKLRKVEDSRK